MLTILFPLYRPDRFLSQSIQSLIDQTFKDYVCIILMPKTLENTNSYITDLIKRDDRFKSVYLNLDGISFALNFGINMSNSKYIARMDADDISYPNRLMSQINFLEGNPDVGVVGGGIDLIDENSQPIAKSFKYYQTNDEIRSALKYRMPLCHPALMFRSEVLFMNKGYLYGNTAEDHELFIRIARSKNIKFYNLPEKILAYRKHSSQSTDFKYAKKAHADISGFMFTEYLLTGRLMYIFGIFANSPLSRKFRSFLRAIVH